MREIPSKFKLIFGVLNLVTSVATSFFMFANINGVKNLFADLGADLPTLIGLIINTSPLIPLINFILYLILGVYFLVSSKFKPAEAKVFDTAALVAWMFMILFSLGVFILVSLPIYQISDYIK